MVMAARRHSKQWSFALPFSVHESVMIYFIPIDNSSLSFKSLRILFAQQTNNKYNLWAQISLNPFPQRDMLVPLVLSYPCVLSFYKILSPGVFLCDLSWTPDCWKLSQFLTRPFNSIPPTWWTWEPIVWESALFYELQNLGILCRVTHILQIVAVFLFLLSRTQN